MENIPSSTKTYFVYHTSCATAVLDCTQETIIEIFSNHSYCQMRYYISEDDLFEDALEIRINNASLLCYFDEWSKCDVCYLILANISHVDAYLNLYNNLLEYCSTSKQWALWSSIIKYVETGCDKYWGFYAHRNTSLQK